MPASKKPARKPPAQRATKPAKKEIGLNKIGATDAKRIAAQEAEWRAQDDLRILRQAQEIQADKSRLAKARQVANKEIQALKKIS